MSKTRPGPIRGGSGVGASPTTLINRWAAATGMRTPLSSWNEAFNDAAMDQPRKHGPLFHGEEGSANGL